VNSFKTMLWPVVHDAAQSIEHGYEDGAIVKIRDWFEQASDETLQFTIMGAVQDALCRELGIERT
jgi:hypothetical protein